MAANITRLGPETPAVFRSIEAEITENTALAVRSLRLQANESQLTPEEVRNLGDVGVGSRVDLLA